MTANENAPAVCAARGEESQGSTDAANCTPARLNVQCVRRALEQADRLVQRLERSTSSSDPTYLELRYLSSALDDAFDELDYYRYARSEQ